MNIWKGKLVVHRYDGRTETLYRLYKITEIRPDRVYYHNRGFDYLKTATRLAPYNDITRLFYNIPPNLTLWKWR
jgi:hypothetical protein